MVNVCAVAGCLSNARHDKNRHFYRFPSEEERRRQWIQACNRPELSEKSPATLKTYYMCDLHFQPSDRITKCLKKFAIPTLNLPKQDIGKPSKLTQTTETHSHCRSKHVDVKDSSCQTDPVYIKYLVSIPTTTRVTDGILASSTPVVEMGSMVTIQGPTTSDLEVTEPVSDIETVVIKVEEDAKEEMEEGIEDEF
ncbi:THAP domain-containing protein [Phthorimaea operculella]|nr:THAP domain-containing protein [Phthorimaea operculella]